MIRRLASRLVAFVATLVALAALALPARADQAPSIAPAVPTSAPIATPPRDVPLVLRAEGIKIPPVPATFQTKDLGWVRFAYTPSAYERVEPLLHDAEEVRARLADEFGQAVLEHVEVRVARTPEEMATLAPLEVPPPPYGSGVAYPSLNLVLLTLMAPQTNAGVDLDEVFRHELTHIALEDAVAHHHVPRWFNEGLAIYESGEKPFDRFETLGRASMYGTLIPLADLDRFPGDDADGKVSIAYAESADFVQFLMRKTDRVRFSAFIERVRGGQAFDRALGDAYGSDVRKLEYQWREGLSKRFTYWPILAGGGIVWLLVIGALVIAYVRRQRRAKATLARWAKEEAAVDAAIRAAHDAETDVGRASFEQIAMKGELPRVEHDGRWHTLH